MAKEKAPVASAAPAEDRKRAIEAAMGQIEKMYGKGSIMRLGDQNNLQVDVIPTGSLSLDEALDELPSDGEQIDRFLQSKLHGRFPEDKEKKRLTDALLRRGFSWGEVRSAWGRYGSEIWEE